jgi:hypothetical protein
MPIAIDDSATWPSAISNALQEALPALRGYQDHRARIDAQFEADPDNAMLRVDPPKNPFRAAREGLADMIDEQIAGSLFLAWHCTRLCDDEIEAVRESGMFTLSPKTFGARIRRRREAGDISAAVAGQLHGANQASDEHRINQFWFVLTRKPLGTSGVRDLLGYWGGEALYRNHDRDAEIGPILRALGKPCIVEIAVRHSAIRTYGSLGMNIVRTFELVHGLKDENPPDCEGHTRQVIPPEQVLRIMTPADGDFAEITAERD